MTSPFKSSFHAPTGVFDICVRLLIQKSGDWKMALVPIQDIGTLTELDDTCCEMQLKTHEQDATVNMPLQALLEKLRSVDQTTGIIDLTAVTGPVAPSPADTRLRDEFKAACEQRGGKFIMLHLYAAPHDEPDRLTESWIKVTKKTEMEPRSNYSESRTFINLKSSESDTRYIECRIPHHVLNAAVLKAWQNNADYLDMRSCCEKVARLSSGVTMRF